MGSTKKNQTPAKPKKPLKRPEKRTLVRWNDDLDRKLLLCIQSACNTQGLRVPWDKVADLMGPSVSEGAIIQHLAKLRIRLADLKLPALRRGGAPSQYSKGPGATNGNGKRRTRSKKGAEDMGSYHDNDMINDDHEYDLDFEFMEEEAAADSDEDSGHVEKKAKTAGGARPANKGSSTTTNGPDDEYVESASEAGDGDASECTSKDNEDDSGGIGQGLPVCALGAKFLDFAENPAPHKKNESFNSLEVNQYPEASKLVKLFVPSMGGRRAPEETTPEHANTGTGDGSIKGEAAKEVYRKNGNELGIGGGIMNQLGLVVHGQLGATMASKYGAQVGGGASAGYTPFPPHTQGMSMGDNNALVGVTSALTRPALGMSIGDYNAFVGATNALAPSAPGSVIYPHHTQYGMNVGSIDAFTPLASSANMMYGQYGIGVGSTSVGIQGVNGSTSLSTPSLGLPTTLASYGSNGVSNPPSSVVWGSNATELEGFGARSSPGNDFFNDAIQATTSMAMAGSIDPCILDGPCTDWGQEWTSQSGHRDISSGFGFGMHNYADSPEAQSSPTNNPQALRDLDDLYGNDILDSLTSGNGLEELG